MRRVLSVALACAVLSGCSGGTASSDAQKLPDVLASAGITQGSVKDQLLRVAVKARLTADDPDSASSLGVNVRDGRATLTGTVRTAAARAKAATLAAQVHDIKGVDNELKVDPKAPSPVEQIGDVALAARIQTAIANQVGLTDISVRVDHGTATLTGTVSEKIAHAAVQTATNTTGIRNVVDHIRVEQQ
jgi:osmotically-inducible protein OsmY